MATIRVNVYNTKADCGLFGSSVANSKTQKCYLIGSDLSNQSKFLTLHCTVLLSCLAWKKEKEKSVLRYA